MVARALFPRLTSFLALLPLSAMPLTAGVDVNPPIPLTNTVTIQPYRAKKQDGTAAVVMGDSASEAYIKQQIGIVLSQSGITLDWLPVIDVVDDFIYDGSPADYSSSARPVGDFPDGEFHQIIASTPLSTTVLKLFFVEIVPYYAQTSDNTANGYAYIDYNGATIHIGANLPGFPEGRDIAAAVIAHEISHNLGLVHVQTTDNLMYGDSRRTSERLTANQTGIMFTEDEPWDGYQLLGPYSAPSNYSVWASNPGLTGNPEDDDDHDGLANVIEFMLGLDGSLPDNHAMPAPAWSPAGLTWTLQKLGDALDDGLTYAIEVSSDGTNWNAAGAAGTGSAVLVDSPTTYAVRLDAEASTNYMRIKVDLTGTLLGGSQAPPKAKAAAPVDTRDLDVPYTPRTSECGLHSCGHRSLETP